MNAIYLYLIICTGSGCDLNRFPMQDLPTCAKFAETFKPAFPPSTTENESSFAVFCAGAHYGYYEGSWHSREDAKKTGAKKP